MNGISAVAQGLAIMAAFLLATGGVKLALGSDTRLRGVLMIVAAVVLIGNVLIWTL